jgi:hypothetical protein
MKMEQSVPKRRIYCQTPGNYPEEIIQHSEHGERLKSRKRPFALYDINSLVFITKLRVFTARYGLIPYITQIRFVFKGIIAIQRI